MIGEYAIDMDSKDVMYKIALGKQEEPFHEKYGYLFYSNRLCTCDKVMYESYAPPHVGHREIQATLKGAEMYLY